MNKEEYLAELRSCLDGKMSPEAVESNIDYYRAYIEGEINRGRDEQEVLDELGPARLIAKNLTANIKDDSHRADEYEQERHGSYDSENPYENEYSDSESGNRRPGSVKARRIAGTVITCAVVILIFFLIFYIFRGAVYLLFRFLPIIFIILLFYSVFRGTSGRR